MQEILVLGDSHSPIFNHSAFKQAFPDVILNIITVIGATASGLENPNSTTQAYPIFRNAADNSTAKQVIVMLGEVDTGFVIWYRAQKYKESVATMMEKTISCYANFLLELKEKFNVICISTPLPTIEDGNDWGEIANARREVKASQFERTALTLEFNRTMQQFCEKNTICYVMLDAESLGENGVVKTELRNRDASDHHYDADTYATLLIEKLTILS